jgi:hypothetical protein
MTDPNKRLAELQAKVELSDAEMNELISLSPAGTFTEMPSLELAGLHNTDQALLNFHGVEERLQQAIGKGFLLEAITLRAQLLELYLRYFLAAVHGEVIPPPPQDRFTLGVLIERAKQKGLDSSLVGRLETFNKGRIAAIHHYLLGSAPYEQLKTVLDGSTGLFPGLVKETAKKIGKPYESKTNGP